MSNIATLDQALGKAAKVLRTLREAGLPEEFLQHVVDDQLMRQRLVDFWLRGGFEAPAGHKQARWLMGKNFFGVEEAAHYFGIIPSATQFAALRRIPFSRKTLEACKDTHLLIAIFPFSIQQIQDKIQNLFFVSQEESRLAWPLMREKSKTGWHLIRKTPARGSFGTSWDAQVKNWRAEGKIPLLRNLLYAIVAHRLADGPVLFRDCRVRCGDGRMNATHLCLVGRDNSWPAISEVPDSLMTDDLGHALCVPPSTDSL